MAAATFAAELDAATTALEAAGLSSARVDAEWLLAGLLGVGRVAVRLDLAETVPAPIAERYAHAVSRRARREPLQRILGWEEFRGVRVRLTDAVLVPRPETETLVEWALALLPPPGGRQLLAIDLGTGSGCIACALASERPDLDVIAVDVSPAAAAVARDNAQALGLAARVGVVAADLLDGLRDLSADLIVSNPPYLPSTLVPELAPEVRIHEPRLALDGGADGLALIRRIATTARRYLRPSGALAVGGGRGSAPAGGGLGPGGRARRPRRYRAVRRRESLMHAKERLTLALPKGRLLDGALELLRELGVEGIDQGSRRLIFTDDRSGLRMLFLKPVDIPAYVLYGAADVGIVGKDILLEQEPDVYEPLDLGFGFCRLVVAEPRELQERDDPAKWSWVRVATKYPRLAEQYFTDRGVQVELVRLDGSVELAPLVGLAERIVDLVQSGETLRANGLVEVAEIARSTARLIVNRASMKTEHAAVNELVDEMKKVLR